MINFGYHLDRHDAAAAGSTPKLYIPSTLNIDLIMWHTQLNMCEQKMLNHGLNHEFFLTLFKLIPCPIYVLNCMCVTHCSKRKSYS